MEELFWYHSYRVKQVIQDLLPHPLRHNLRNRAGSWNSAQAKLLYTTLPAKSIRLLNINPGLSCENLSCSLEVVKLEDRPPFEALSYVWGKPDPLVEITCNNIAIHITPNLAAALHRIREPLAPKPRKVWVDAICINQDDDLERSSQVMFMKDIYSKAEKVLIWLGETDCGADIFNNAVENIDAMSSIVKWGHGTPAPDQHQIAKTFRKTKHNHESSAKIKQWIESNPSWSIFVQMISAPWFTRVWVLQEFAHAQSITLLTGPHSLSSFSLFLSCIYIHKHRYDLPTPTIAHINRAVRVYDLRFPSHLLPQIETATIFNATDPRDIIFAVLGLPSVEHDRDFDSRSLLRPDYTKPVWEVYGNVVRHFVSAPRVRPFREFIDDPETPIGGERFGEGVLDILRPPELCDLIPDFERDITKGGEFPSWVPRWDLNSEVHRQPPGLWAQDPKFLWEPAGKKDVTYFPPSTNSSLSEEERERENRTLKLKGGKLTSVAIILDEYLLPLSKNERNSPNTVKKLLDIVRGLFTLRSENGNQALRYAGPGSVEGDFAVVVTAGTKRGGTPHPSLRSKSSMSVRRNGSVEALRAGGGDSPAQEIETERGRDRGKDTYSKLKPK
ncbi:hypothetical protein G7Y89_g15845 [Cudoniella acicularis]|uniref:Heterokaryon incompatibility domain-containing protein n=1 Tax=Cudoniella acicularis TaxID=354080 RepID=A0A8H4QF21_9HELO|nr:hypothetical protein G7Y89_g15845 [Cudoniella acicularis]